MRPAGPRRRRGRLTFFCVLPSKQGKRKKRAVFSLQKQKTPRFPCRQPNFLINLSKYVFLHLKSLHGVRYWKGRIRAQPAVALDGRLLFWSGLRFGPLKR